MRDRRSHQSDKSRPAGAQAAKRVLRKDHAPAGHEAVNNLVAHICLPLRTVAHISHLLGDVGLLIPHHSDLQGLNHSCNGAPLRFGNEQMHVIGHDHEAVDEKVVSQTSAL